MARGVTMQSSLNTLKSCFQTVKPVIEKQVAAIPSGLDILVVRGISLSTMLAALVSICVVFTMTMHFTTESAVSVTAQVNHMYKPLPDFMQEIRRQSAD